MEITLYGVANIKMMVLGTFKSLSSLQIALSAGVLLYYIGYLARISVGCMLGEVKELKKRPSTLWILFHGYRSKATSKFHALFIPLNVIKNISAIIIIVIFSKSPNYQAGISLCVYTFFFFLNLCFCPWVNSIRIWFHLQELTFALQLGVLFYLVRIKEKSRISPSIVLIVLNFLQLFIIIGMVITVLYRAGREKLCLKKNYALGHTP